MNEYDLYSEFDIEQHKKTFINYLEVLIEPDGHVMYAIPSHQELAIRLACEAHNCSRDELDAMCPQEYYCDFMTWLLMQTGCISVWDTMYIGNPNEKQVSKLQELHTAGLYKGVIKHEAY